ncbi:hypothetical protein BDN72DRAFT_841834 [Pluteus cervinus]|uniref:Uncharacterized protein n=1 Tax=Pluteus cervinus TaxID=181527 RepID=A0ACD3ARV4_9AGAR|nr:hypothetical protein BDN72DRAFT_841834 [Pluteus cervinus]
MSAQLEQAVAALMYSGTPIAVHTVLMTYLRISGFSTICHDAIVAFEHALDKHGDQPTSYYTAAIIMVRDQYWFDKVGQIEEEHRHSRGRCTCTEDELKQRVSRSVSTCDAEVSTSPEQRQRRRTRGKRSKNRASASPSESQSPSPKLSFASIPHLPRTPSQ